MDGVKLSEIKGLMLDKKLEAYDGDLSSEYWNKAITEQGRRSIGLDREKLAIILFNQGKDSFTYSESGWGDLDNISPFIKMAWLIKADAIIADEKDIFKVMP